MLLMLDSFVTLVHQKQTREDPILDEPFSGSILRE